MLRPSGVPSAAQFAATYGHARVCEQLLRHTREAASVARAAAPDPASVRTALLCAVKGGHVSAAAALAAAQGADGACLRAACELPSGTREEMVSLVCKACASRHVHLGMCI